MRRLMILTTSILLLSILGLTAGCASQGSEGEAREGKILVVTSFFPLYDFAKTIGGEHVALTNLVPAGVEPHDWTPKSQDMVHLTKSQLFVYQGAGFEGWTDDVLDSLDLEHMTVVEASQGIELLAADGEEDRGHEHEDEHGHEHEHEHEDGGHADEPEHGHDHGQFDPHTWLSPRSALQMAENIVNGLKLADPAHAADYEANYEDLKAKLTALDQSFQEQLSGLSKKEMVVSHQAFGYLARDYGLVQMPIMGISPEGEPTAQVLKQISEFVKEHDVSYIFTEQLVSDKLASTLAADLGVQTLPLHPLEGLTEAELVAGENYISLMEKNLENLRKALK